MNSKKIYSKLDSDFITNEMSDKWFEHMKELPVANYLSENFKKRSMGLVCDFTNEVNQVYTAVFPSDDVMQKILDEGVENAMLFVHHPSIWDITKAPEVFSQMDVELLRQFKKRNISIYNLHVPLDSYGEYSTSKTLADAIGVKIEKPFFEYHGGLAGVIGITDCKNLAELRQKFEKIVGHKVGFYKYGNEKIENQRVAIVAGGGNDLDVLTELKQEGINVLITGITALNNHSKKVHDFEKVNKISLLGGTHYSTETFACKEMCKYFEKLNLPCKFVEETPIMEDM
jgi:putative NIF3 family GTP cyclohydrolase 1 type 2